MGVRSKIPCKEASYGNVSADQTRGGGDVVWMERGKWAEVTTEVKARTGEGEERQRRVESGEWYLPLM